LVEDRRRWGQKLKSVAIEYIVENNLSFLSSAERQVTLGEELWGECMEYMTAHYKVVKKSGDVKNGKEVINVD